MPGKAMPSSGGKPHTPKKNPMRANFRSTIGSSIKKESRDRRMK